jgi:hypothetical protein
MPIHAKWDNDEHTLVLMTFEGKWSWDDYDHGVAVTYALVKSAPHTVDIISYMPPGMLLPAGSPITHLKRAMQDLPENLGKMVFIGSDKFGEVLIDNFGKVYKRIRNVILSAPTIEDARKTLKSIRENQ